MTHRFLPLPEVPMRRTQETSYTPVQSPTGAVRAVDAHTTTMNLRSQTESVIHV